MAFFHQGLAEAGYVEGRNLDIEYRWADGNNDRLPSLASDLVNRQVAVIATPGSTPAALAAKAATNSIPIVFWVATDPVEVGLVARFNRPGGNITGVAILGIELIGKRLQILLDLVPTLKSVGLLVNTTNRAATEASIREAEVATRVLGLQLLVRNASNKAEIEEAFGTLAEQGANAFMSTNDPVFFTQTHQLVELAARHRVPMISPFPEFSVAGGLMSYGASLDDPYRQVGIYTGRILKGEKPADLPVMQSSTRIETILNLKAAKALSLEVPTSILLRADQVIE